MKKAGFTTLHKDKRSKKGAFRLTVYVLDNKCVVCEGPMFSTSNAPYHRRLTRTTCSAECKKNHIRMKRLAKFSKRK